MIGEVLVHGPGSLTGIRGRVVASQLLACSFGVVRLETVDYDRLGEAWWAAAPHDHGQLDALVFEALIDQDHRREEHNRKIRGLLGSVSFGPKLNLKSLARLPCSGRAYPRSARLLSRRHRATVG
jgi:hypothetical protein